MREKKKRRNRLPTPLFLGFPCGSTGKESACNAGDLGLIPVLGRSPEEGKGYPFQYCGLENSRDCIVHGVAKSQTQLSNFHFTFSWRKKWQPTLVFLPGKPQGQRSLEGYSLWGCRVRHDLATKHHHHHHPLPGKHDDASHHKVT